MHDATHTHTLAAHIAASRFEDLPAHVVEHAKLLVLDTLGVAIYGATLPWCDRLRATAKSMEAPGKSTVWGTSQGYSAPTAAMVNATATHAFELDDVGPGGHNGSVTLSSALAIAQHTGRLSGKDLINAVVVGIETAARIGNCVGRVPHEGLGFHNPGLLGSFASVASAGRSHALGADDMVHALGHAGQQAASLMFTHHGGMGKRLLAGQAARAGTFGTLLAANGFTNADNVFEAEYGGFCAAHTGNRRPPLYDLTAINRDWGSHYFTPSVRFKMWATRVPNHASLEGIRALRRQRNFQADEVKELRIRLGKGYIQNVAWAYTPTTITSAQLNLYFVAAVMLLENDVFIDQFTEQAIADPKVLAMIERISVTHDASLDGKQYDHGNPVEVTLNDGTVLSGWGMVRGGPENPTTRADVVEKFGKLTSRVLDAKVRSRLIERCDALETLEDATALIEGLESARLS
jgi:aconitate decarboxylase